MKLKYIGDGASLPGVPARDLSEEEVKQFGESELLGSGLYQIADEQPKKSKRLETPFIGDGDKEVG